MTFEWTKKEKGLCFEELKKGEVFYIKDDRSTVFMKTDEKMGAYEVYNAVNFSNGTLVHFCSRDEVEKVKAKMVLSSS